MKDPAAPRIQDLSALPSLEEVRAEQCRRELKHFIRDAWDYIEHGTDFIDNWHVDAISEHLEALFHRQIKRLIINFPPRCMKSTIASVSFPAWAWLRDPGFKLVTCSYERGLAVRDAIKARRLFDTEWFVGLNRRQGEPIFRMRSLETKMERLKDSEDWYENDKGGHRISIGVDTGVTGKGGNIISVDDPQDPQRAFSDVERVNTLTWWDQTMSTRLNNMKRDLKLIVMQRLHVFDLSGHELSKNLGYVHLLLPMRYKPSAKCVTSLGINYKTGKPQSWSDPRTKEGELLWPARFDEEAVHALETDLGPYGSAGQLQQEPIPSGGGIFKAEWFKYWDKLPILDLVAFSIDAAFTAADDSSFVVLQVWGFKGPDCYVLDNYRAHLAFTQTEDMIRQYRQYYRANKMTPSAIIIERKANGYAIINRLSREIPGIDGIAPRESKESRAAAVAPFVAAGNVFLPARASWLANFMTEMTFFPKYKSDDQVDAFSQMLWWRFLKDVDVEKGKKADKFKRWASVDLNKTSTDLQRLLRQNFPKG